MLHETAAKAGLQISYEKTQYMEKQKNYVYTIRPKFGTIERVEKFKYLGEFIQIGGSNKASNVDRTEKLQKAYKITMAHYNKKCISRQAKL